MDKIEEQIEAVRKTVTVDDENSIEIENLPFEPGTEVDVIVIAEKKRVEDIYAYTKELRKRKKIPRYSVKDIEDIIHESRGVNA